jgi:uncharacterized membrane protein
MLAVVLAMRFRVLVPEERPVLLPILAVVIAYAVASAALQSVTMLLYYPVLVNFSLCAVFANSLRHEESILLRLIRARGVQVSKYGPKYIHRLTACWAIFFAVNGIIALWSTTLSIEAWTAYNGLIAYVIVGALVGGERIFRRYYKKHMGVWNP